MGLLDFFFGKTPADKHEKQSTEERDRQLRLAREKRERKAAKTHRLVEAGYLKAAAQPQWKPWHEAAKDLNMEGCVMGADYARDSDRTETFEPARLEEKEGQ